MLHGSGAGRVGNALAFTAPPGRAHASKRRRAASGDGDGAPCASSALCFRAAVAVAAVAILTSLGCKKKEKEGPISVPPPQGAASADELSTGIGQARALGSTLAPTSTRWQRAFVLDDKRAILAGELETESIALITENAGRTWRSLRRVREGWSAWSVGENGAMALAVGPRSAPNTAKDPRRYGDAGAPERSPTNVFFAPFDAMELSAASVVALPELRHGSRAPIDLTPAVLSAESAAMVVEQAAPRRSLLLYAGLSGAEPLAPVAFPPQERALPTPYGRPPTLLSVRGRNLLARPVPAPGKPLDPPQQVDGLVMTPAAVTALSALPACEIGGNSIQLVPQPPDKTAVIAISSMQTAVFALPAKPTQGATLGCGADHVTLEVVDPKSGEPTLATCSLDGSCVLAEKPPFRPWLEPHEQYVVSASTRTGVAAVLASRAASRWGLYMAQSLERGKIYEVPRVIGEGTGERGRIELGALLSFGNRLLVLLQADVTGTSRRGWYAAISDDGGLSWNPP